MALAHWLARDFPGYYRQKDRLLVADNLARQPSHFS
jgi:hypothetical protein